MRGKGVEDNEQRQSPELQGDQDRDAAVDDFREVAEDEEKRYPQYLGRNAEKVCLCRSVPKVSQREREVGLGRLNGNYAAGVRTTKQVMIGSTYP